jgi:hypothetical protein
LEGAEPEEDGLVLPDSLLVVATFLGVEREETFLTEGDVDVTVLGGSDVLEVLTRLIIRRLMVGDEGEWVLVLAGVLWVVTEGL